MNLKVSSAEVVICNIRGHITTKRDPSYSSLDDRIYDSLKISGDWVPNKLPFVGQN